MKSILDWSVAIGKYPGLVLGVRDYNYEESVEQDGNTYTTKDRVVYLPFIMIIFTWIYVEQNQS